MRVLVLGAGGQLGGFLVAAARAAGHDVVALGRAQADLASDCVTDTIYDARPDVIYNAAAYTDVDGAEADPAGATAVNDAGVRRVARAARNADARLVTFSTDYVFDGRAGRPYDESDAPSPMQAYGRSKRAGEIAALEEHPDATWVVRTCWVFSAGGRTFLPSILRAARERDELTVVADQVGSPTYAPDLAVASLSITDVAPGVVHLVSGGEPVSRIELARAAIVAAGLQVTLHPTTAAAFAAAAPRPANSALVSAVTGVPELPDWREAVARMVAA
jgi:dTDP-4-dehydrorhamnose reductase